MLNRGANGNRKVIAVFVTTAQEAAEAVAHLTRGDVRLPILLYSREDPPAVIARHCAGVVVNRNALLLLTLAFGDLLGRWVALGVVAWSRNRNSCLLKTVPFLLPPFRVLVMNEHGDFFPGRPPDILRHWNHRVSSCLRTAASWTAGAIRVFATESRALLSWLIGAAGVIGSEMQTALSWVTGGMRWLVFKMRELAANIYIPGAFELVAQFSSPISRYVFSLFRGSEMLVISARRKRPSGVVVIELTNGEWRRREILRVLSGSESRWVAFQETDPAEPWDDMLSFFAESRTFAVSRQTAFQGWLKTVLPCAPFRALQADEATQVLAPLSTQLIFDLEKLMALGLPDLRSSAANFMLLFWRAAAAGWRSYSVGSTLPVQQLPTMPLAEAQFVQALLRDRRLARLQPRDGALTRGNVVRRTKGGNPFRNKTRILIVSPFLPFPLSHGGAVRIYNLCRLLSNRFDLILACFREKNDVTDYAHLHEVFREVYVLGINEAIHDPSLPPAVAGYESSAMRALIPRICAEHHIDLMQIEYTQMAGYREAAPDVPAILVEHDITFSLYRQFAERDKTSAAERAYRCWLKFETERLRVFDSVWTMSDSDRELAIESGASPSSVMVVPNGVDIGKFHGAPEPEGSTEILYVGSFRHLPNFLAFQELCGRIMPLVWRTVPSATLRVVAGPNHEDYWTGSRQIDSRITVHGFVPDVAPLYRKCAVVVAPLPVSAGTNIKVMEALASERAIVTTPIGCSGLGLRNGVDAVICDLGPSFAQSICRLLRNPGVRRAIARQGRVTAETRFSWESIKDLAAESYDELLGEEESIVAS